MKKIEAIVRKTKFEEVKEALLAADINWFEYHKSARAARSASIVASSIPRT